MSARQRLSIAAVTFGLGVTAFWALAIASLGVIAVWQAASVVF
jgi:hypothetical protein